MSVVCEESKFKVASSVPVDLVWVCLCDRVSLCALLVYQRVFGRKRFVQTMTSAAGRRDWGIGLGVGAVLAGSPVFVIVRILKHSNAFTQIVCRNSFFLLVTTSYSLYKWRTPRNFYHKMTCLQWRGFMACVLLASQSIAICSALLLTSVSNVALLINTSPCFCCLLDLFCLGENVPKRTAAMIILGLLSVGIIIGGDVAMNPSNTLGNFVALINPICWALFWAINREKALSEKKYISRSPSSAAGALLNGVENVEKDLTKWDRILALQVGSGVSIIIISALANLLFDPRNYNTVKGEDWVYYFILGGLCLPVCIGMFSLAPVYITTSEMGCIKMLETVLAPVLIFLYNGEQPSGANTYIGGTILIVTIVGHSILAILEDRAKPVIELPPIVPRRDRVNCMRKFLEMHFPRSFLQSGIILDVAGGKGDLAFLLQNVEGFNCAVVDPRRTDHSKLTKIALWYLDHPKERKKQASEGQSMALLALKPPFKVPTHLKVYLDDEFLQAFDTPLASSAWHDFWTRAIARADAEEGTKGHHQPQHAEANPWVADRILDSGQAKSLLQSACLVVGFHPDQATEACIDLALTLKIPFVVCPCCVFPSEFTHRRLKKSEKSVRSYDDFLVYLQEKHARIRLGKLNFQSKGQQARNIVLYMLPEDFY